MRGWPSTAPRPATTQVRLVAAAAGPADGELLIETDGDNLGASHIVSGEASGKAIRVPSLRLQRILEEAGVSHVDALKIDVEGFEDRVLTGFFANAPQSLWPRAVVIEHLSPNEWLARLHRRHARAGLCRDRQDPQQHAAGPRLNFRIAQIAVDSMIAIVGHRGFGFADPWSFPAESQGALDYEPHDEVTQAMHDRRVSELMKKIGFAMLVTR